MEKKRSSGLRCMAYGCSHTYQDGYFIHVMPGKMPTETERFSSHQRSWLNFIGKRRNMQMKDFRKYKRVTVCSGHFMEDDYKSTEVQMFKRGLRMKTPSLGAEAIPVVDNAVHPFPPSWFIPSSLASPVPMDETEASSGVTGPSSSSGETGPSPTLAADLGPSSTKRKRGDSSYIRKQEVKVICSDYDRKMEEDLARERAEDLFDRSKGEQCSVKMKDQKVGCTRKKKSRTCKIQVRQNKSDKGSQAGIFTKPTRTSPTILYSDASSQTTESSFSQDEEKEAIAEDFEVVDDERRDPTYKPDDDEEIEAVQKATLPDNILEEGKFIVFETNLISLFEICLNCLSRKVNVEKVKPQSFGSAVKVQASCESCGTCREWYSQPMVGNMMAGNLLLSSAILFGGASPTKVLRVMSFMNLKAISLSTFMEHQSTYLQPAIIRVSDRMQQGLIRKIGEERVILGGDGRADSPGHSAKYGAYTLMDMRSKKIINIQLVQSNEVTSSNAMEKEGLVRAMTKLHEQGVKVEALVTDRHASVAKWMREEHPDIKHQYDVWHLAKGIQKKITAISKQKDCELAGLWKRSIIRHVYWAAASTQDGNGELMAAKYTSIFNHICNVHQHDGVFERCEHAEDYPQREWMKEGTKVFGKLSEELLKTRLVNDVKKMSPLAQTSSVESFHSVMLHFCPKMLAYSYAGMKCRLLLAAIHWNENSSRAQATKKDGSPIFRISYPKAKEGRHSVSKVLTACTYGYVDALMHEAIHIVTGKLKLRSDIPELEGKAPLCSKHQRVDKDEAVRLAKTHQRFNEFR